VSSKPASASSYQVLYDAIMASVSTCTAPELDRFTTNLAQWGTERCEVANVTLRAADYLAPALASANPCARGLLQAFVDQRDAVLWEQSYKAQDGLVGEDMLSRYGFVEVIGGRGPFLSDTVRAGVGVFGPHVNYPTHHHRAEEIYLVLAGRGVFNVGETTSRECGPGAIVYVLSDTPHSMQTQDEPLVVLYLWQNGTLRQQSSFQ